LEQVIKAEFIARFTYYIDWPADAFKEADSSFQVCTLGEGPLLPQIRNVLSRTSLKARKVSVHAIDSGRVDGCHLLYVAPGVGSRLEEAVRRIDGAPVLTIGDTPGYGNRGLMINLFLEGEHVRFKINSAAAKAKGLNVSSKLLALGKPVANE
jgi:hypothetical protein